MNIVKTLVLFAVVGFGSGNIMGCAVSTEAPTPSASAKATSTVRPADESDPGCTGTQCYGDGDTGGGSILPGGGPYHHCPTGPEIISCVRECYADTALAPDVQDACASSCSLCD
jgi:hypothetical protein